VGPGQGGYTFLVRQALRIRLSPYLAGYLDTVPVPQAFAVGLGDGEVEMLGVGLAGGAAFAVVLEGCIAAYRDGSEAIAPVEAEGVATCGSVVHMLRTAPREWPLLLWGQALEIYDAFGQASSIPVVPI
jgi:hypothetical protein